MLKKKIMVDMDEVIINGGFLELVNCFLHTNYQESDFTSYYMQEAITNKQEFFKWYKSKNRYDYCELIPNCYEVLKKLNDIYEVYIATSYIFPEIYKECAYIVEQKFNYLQKHLPFITPYQYIFLTNKSLLDVDIKIDDRIDNLLGNNEKLLYTAYHNKQIDDEILKNEGVKRVDNWLEIEDILIRKRVKN